MTVSGILIAISVAVILFCVFMMHRNNKVYRYRQAILGMVSHCASEDIQSGRPWEWRYQVLYSATYDEMMSKFWRKLDSFYPDKSFIEPGGTHE